MKPYKLKMCLSNNPTALNSVVDDNHTNEEMQVDIGLPEDPDFTETLDTICSFSHYTNKIACTSMYRY